jgi:hypothetical protein
MAPDHRQRPISSSRTFGPSLRSWAPGTKLDHNDEEERSPLTLPLIEPMTEIPLDFKNKSEYAEKTKK